MTKKITSILLVLVTLFTISSFSFTADALYAGGIRVNYAYYNDVDRNNWANPYISAAKHYGLMQGVGNNEFHPDEPIKHAHFVSVVNNKIKYVENSSNYNNISRTEAVRYIWKAAGIPWAYPSLICNYSDYSSVPECDSYAWAWCIQNGIVNGDNGRLKPMDCLSRAEAATLLVRAYCIIKFCFRVTNINVVYPNIVSMAKDEIGNYGGYKYKNWYGVNDAWCAMFVSWCACQSGLMNYSNRFAYCPSGQSWFKSQGKWNNSYYKGGNYIPKPGDIIFFDWNYSNNIDLADHVGIVEKVQNNIVYTIEGNSSNSVKSRSYSIYSAYILGYGILN